MNQRRRGRESTLPKRRLQDAGQIRRRARQRIPCENPAMRLLLGIAVTIVGVALADWFRRLLLGDDD